MIEIEKKNLFSKTIENRRLQATPLQESFENALSIAGAFPPDSPRDERILEIIHQTLSWVEQYGAQKALEEKEPAYHNRQHFADASIALAFFLKDLNHFTKFEKLLLLLTILVHDFGHEGLDPNEANPLHEEKTVRLLSNSPLRELSRVDFDLICNLILGTRPTELNRAKKLYLENPENQFFLMQCLINDADIAASFIESLTLQLSRSILIELGHVNPNHQQIQESAEFFKRNYQITTPIAKSYLGILD